jgi:hypothetical protein
LNKKLISKNLYVKLSSGDMIRFGQSTRWFILGGGPSLDNEENED